ncbi:hypothetical protein ACQPZQ_14730 [Pseudonocardia sp. CA-142604]|uniref:hypothetical protein n=1 Tax=Pseudonocardia sp. CA-142604 TaxID=3240024 RepID=UPI003D8B17FC
MATMSSHEEREIRSYVMSQPHAAGDAVNLVQKVGRRRVGGGDHDLYDVWMDSGRRFWVITNMTCLYAQEEFNDLEQVFTYHLGRNQILHEQFRPEVVGNPIDALPKPWRKYASAVNAMAEALESEDFQAVGIRCREVVLALAREYQNEDWVVITGERPKVADATGWIDLYVNSLTANKKPRAYVKALADRVWDLAVWLQHYWDATESDAELVLGATQQLMRAFQLLLARHAEGVQVRCPDCDSYRVVEETGELVEVDGSWGTYLHDECASCGWTSEAEFDEWEVGRLKRFIAYHSGEWGPQIRLFDELAPADEVDGGRGGAT